MRIGVVEVIVDYVGDAVRKIFLRKSILNLEAGNFLKVRIERNQSSSGFLCACDYREIG